MSNYGNVIEFYLADIYNVCCNLVREQELANRLTRQTFIDFYDRYENVKSDWIYLELVSTAKKLAEHIR